MHRLGSRVVVKPTRGGSALGISGVDGLAALPSALVETYAYCEDALIERFHDGIDVSVVVLETADGLRSLRPIAIEYEKGHEFDFSARYTAEFVSLGRPDLPQERLDRLGEIAREAHRLLGLRDLSRSDLIIDADGEVWFLEVNVAPGLTETSTVPLSVTAAGLDLGALMAELVDAAVRRG